MILSNERHNEHLNNVFVMSIFILKGGMRMINCSIKSSINQIKSTEEILEFFKLSENKLIWYIKAAELQLSSPGCRGIKFMGKEVRCSYSIEDPAEADFELRRKDGGIIHILVALDLKRIVLFTTINNYSYEIWIGYKSRGKGYSFYEKLYDLNYRQTSDNQVFAK